MGVPGVGWRRSHEADRHRLGETMLQLPCAAEGGGLHVLEVSRVTGALAEPGATRLLCPREAQKEFNQLPKSSSAASTSYSMITIGSGCMTRAWAKGSTRNLGDRFCNVLIATRQRSSDSPSTAVQKTAARPAAPSHARSARAL